MTGSALLASDPERLSPYNRWRRACVVAQVRLLEESDALIRRVLAMAPHSPQPKLVPPVVGCFTGNGG